MMFQVSWRGVPTNGNKYYYRALSIRVRKTFKKRRKYLGKNLSKKELLSLEKKADRELKFLKGLERLKPRIVELLKKSKIKKAGIFGSYATGTETKDSDIDIIIEPSKDMGFGFANLEIELSKKLGKKVDLVTYNGLSPYLKEAIMEQEVRIL